MAAAKPKSSAFRQAVASVQEAFENSRSSWMPPEGDYDCYLVQLQDGVGKVKEPKGNEKKGDEFAWIKPIFQISGGENDEKQFGGEMYSFRETTMPMTKEFFETALGNDFVDDALANIDRINELAEAGQLAVRVHVGTRTDNKGGKWPVAKIVEVIPLDEAPPVDEGEQDDEGGEAAEGNEGGEQEQEQEAPPPPPAKKGPAKGPAKK